MQYNGYKIEGDGTFGQYVIKVIGFGGSIPDFLTGSFSKREYAKQAIDTYLFEKAEAAANYVPRVKKVKLYPREVKEDATESDDIE